MKTLEITMINPKGDVTDTPVLTSVSSADSNRLLADIVSIASQLDFSRRLHQDNQISDDELNVVWDELSETLSSAGLDQQKGLPETVAAQLVARDTPPQDALEKLRQHYPPTETGYPDQFLFAVLSQPSLTNAWLSGLGGLLGIVNEADDDDPDNDWNYEDAFEMLQHHLGQSLPEGVSVVYVTAFFNNPC